MMTAATLSIQSGADGRFISSTKEVNFYGHKPGGIPSCQAPPVQVHEVATPLAEVVDAFGFAAGAFDLAGFGDGDGAADADP